jgi:2-dehydropantoate 2-reductase
MRIIIFGAGVQGTLYGVLLARAGHEVTLIARGKRAEELRERGATIAEVLSGRTDSLRLPVAELLAPDDHADLCLVSVRREQIAGVLKDLRAASAIDRIVFMVNHANGSEDLFNTLGRKRVVLAFPGAAGCIEAGVDRYVEIREQLTAVEANALDVILLFRGAGIRVAPVGDLDAWLRRHAVFVTAVAGAIYEASGDIQRLASDREAVGRFIVAVREGWSALDRRGVRPATLALRTIFCWVPLPFAISYWRRLFGSVSGEFYFARHVRRAPAEMSALAADVRELLDDVPAPCLDRLYAAITHAAANPQAINPAH